MHFRQNSTQGRIPDGRCLGIYAPNPGHRVDVLRMSTDRED